MSPRTLARTAGLFYLLTIITGGVAFALAEKLFVVRDGAATVANLLGRESLMYLGFATNLLSSVCYIAVTALFYRIFKAVDATTSLAAAFFSLVGCAIGAISVLFYVAPMAILHSAKFQAIFSATQIQELVLLSFRLSARCTNIGFVFFGVYCLLIGTLIVRATFLPRVVGMLMLFAGLGWLTFLWPPLVNALAPFNFLPGFVGEATLTFWLLIAGVNAERWTLQAGASQ
ncbi:MAG TPA: DUF4386 domain-containing protein [Thermoanaerobaculia bacterium]|nr:DUF4386 domain-containing protein [Thermoanaerobaculia bacterium]